MLAKYIFLQWHFHKYININWAKWDGFMCFQHLRIKRCHAIVAFMGEMCHTVIPQC